MIFKEKGPIQRPPNAYISWSDHRVYVKTKDENRIRCETIGQPVTADTMYPNSAFKKYYPAIWKALYSDEVQPLQELDIGTFALILGAGIKSGIYQILLNVLGPLNANAVMDYATYSILYHKNANSNMAKLMNGKFLFSEECHDDDWYSNLFSNVLNDGVRNRILHEWRAYCKETGSTQSWHSCDGSNFDSGLSESNLAAFGDPKSKKDTKIISCMWVVCADGKNRGLPFSYHIDVGNRIDAKSFMETLATLGDNEIDMVGFILDRGFCYEQVVNGMRNAHYSYLLMLKDNTVGYKFMKQNYADLIHNNYAYRIKAEHEMCAITHEGRIFASDNELSQLCLVQYTTNSFFSGQRLRDNCFENEEIIRKAISAGQPASVPSCVGQYMHIIEKDGKQELVVDADKITHDSNLKGYKVLASDKQLSASEMVRIYKLRQASETQYSVLKTQLGNESERGHSDENVEGRGLVAFVASILRATITMVCHERKLDTNVQIAGMSSLKLINNDDFYAPVMNLFVEEKKFFAEFGIKEEHFQAFAEIANERKNHPKRRRPRIHDIPEEEPSHRRGPNSGPTGRRNNTNKNGSQPSESKPEQGRDDQCESEAKSDTSHGSGVSLAPVASSQTGGIEPDHTESITRSGIEPGEKTDGEENVTPPQKKNNRGRKFGSKNRTEYDKEVDWPRGHRGRPTMIQKNAKEKFLSLNHDEKKDLLKYFPNFDDLVDILNKLDDERRAELEKRRSLSPN